MYWRYSCWAGWNFLFTGSTTLSMEAYRRGKGQAQAAINFAVFAVMAFSSLAQAPWSSPGLDPVELGSLPRSCWREPLAVSMAPGHPGRLSYWLLAQQSVLSLKSAVRPTQILSTMPKYSAS